MKSKILWFLSSPAHMCLNQSSWLVILSVVISLQTRRDTDLTRRRDKRWRPTVKWPNEVINPLILDLDPRVCDDGSLAQGRWIKSIAGRASPGRLRNKPPASRTDQTVCQLTAFAHKRRHAPRSACLFSPAPTEFGLEHLRCCDSSSHVPVVVAFLLCLCLTE